MSITKKDVEDVARLARLALTEEEKELYASQLSRILTYVEKLKELDTTGVEPTTHAMPTTRAFREDVVMPSLPREDAIQNAPDREKGCFKVPRIIE